MSQRYVFEDTKLKALIYGQPGSGKTRLSASAAMDKRFGKVLMLEAFGNPISIKDYDPAPDIITIEDIADFNEPYAWLAAGQPKDDFCKDFGLKPPYDTLIVDGLTEVQRLVTRKITGIDFTSPGDLTGRMDRQGFGQLLGTMLNWAVHYIQLDMHVILTSLEATRQETQGGLVHARPLLWGQSGNEICGYVYMVVRVVTALAAEKTLYTDGDDPVTVNTHNVAYFSETSKYYAKEQYGLAADFINHLTDPTMGKILDLLERSKT